MTRNCLILCCIFFCFPFLLEFKILISDNRIVSVFIHISVFYCTLSGACRSTFCISDALFYYYADCRKCGGVGFF